MRASEVTRADQLAIEPGTERWYEKDPDFFVKVALEWCHEWQYAGDEHNYCHQRSVVVGLLREIDRLRAQNAKRRPT